MMFRGPGLECVKGLTIPILLLMDASGLRNDFPDLSGPNIEEWDYSRTRKKRSRKGGLLRAASESKKEASSLCIYRI